MGGGGECETEGKCPVSASGKELVAGRRQEDERSEARERKGGRRRERAECGEDSEQREGGLGPLGPTLCSV